MSTVADAFDAALKQQSREAAAELDDVTLAALALHRQLVSERKMPDDAKTLLGLHQAINMGMEEIEGKALKVTGKSLAPELRRKTLGHVSGVIADRVREGREKQARALQEKRKLPK